MEQVYKITLAGEGGQGVQSVAEILAEAANSEGKEALYIPNFGVEQRGGVSVAFVQIADNDQRIGAPKFRTADLLVPLSPRAVDRTKQYAGEQTLFIYDSSLIQPAEVNDHIVGLQYYETVPPCPTDRGEAKVGEKDVGDPKSCMYQVETSGMDPDLLPHNVKKIIPIPANDVAKNELHPRVFNIIILGAVIGATNLLPINTVKQALEDKLADKFNKKPELRDMNYKALERGYDMVTKLMH